jgi:hypothetical protein
MIILFTIIAGASQLAARITALAMDGWGCDYRYYDAVGVQPR